LFSIKIVFILHIIKYITVYFRLILDFKQLQQESSVFYTEIISNPKSQSLHFSIIVEDVDLTNIYLELLYEHIKFDLHQKLLHYSKDYKRFYFRLKHNEDFLEVPTRTRKRDDETTKKVVTYHEYGKNKFFRHLAVELKIKIFEGSVWIIVNPKYLFTKDKKEPLEPKLITKYTNYLTAREFNNEYTNLLHFWKTYLFKGLQEWDIYVSNNSNIVIEEYKEIQVPFGISIDVKSLKKKTEIVIDNSQQTFSFDEN